VKELLGTDGELRRFFLPNSAVFSYDENGHTSVRELGLAM
jgi:hypothetical protein